MSKDVFIVHLPPGADVQVTKCRRNGLASVSVSWRYDDGVDRGESTDPSDLECGGLCPRISGGDPVDQKEAETTAGGMGTELHVVGQEPGRAKG